MYLYFQPELKEWGMATRIGAPTMVMMLLQSVSVQHREFGFDIGGGWYHR
jgi:hypothetical protein